MTEVKVTVLVAVYNAGRWLRSCLDSLRRQTLADWQAVCIDDASTDDSLSILQEYAADDSRFEVIHLSQNGGQAAARNRGLQQARGEVICMLDADDWLSDDALQLLCEAFDATTDCVLFDVVNVYADGREERYPMEPFTLLTGEEAFRLSLTWQLHGLYGVRAQIHRRYTYDETCRLYSDDNTTRLHYLSSRRVGSCRGVYYYRQHPQSATHLVSVRRFDYLRANESMAMQLRQLGIDRRWQALYENHRWQNLVGIYMFYFVHGRELTAAERRYGRTELLRIWKTVDRSLLNKETITKFGYRPCASWLMFRCQEWLYFTLRGLLGKNY